jgi:hypothetical protein
MIIVYLILIANNHTLYTPSAFHHNTISFVKGQYSKANLHRIGNMSTVNITTAVNFHFHFSFHLMRLHLLCLSTCDYFRVLICGYNTLYSLYSSASYKYVDDNNKSLNILAIGICHNNQESCVHVIINRR